jgi:DNA repair protein RadA/Sms
MAKRHTVFVCQECGSQSAKWLGRCPECGAWNSFLEERIEAEPSSEASGWAPAAGAGEPLPYKNIGSEKEERSGSGIPGFDLVLGGGMVPGSLVLVAGEPGAGKSTLMLQVAAHVAGSGTVLYVSGEESRGQVKMRGQRLGIDPENLLIYSETQLERIIETVERVSPVMVVVDSVQTAYSPKFSSAPGSVSQVREAAARLLLLAKSTGIPIFLVGHVTKDGLIAGPKAMEHIVDAVVMLEGERFHTIRALRALKNRFGPVSEMAVFEMRADGLREVPNPSQLFLEERAVGIAGSAVTATVEGTRPLLIEVQALVSPSAFGPGRRTAEGFDHNRLALLLAVLERRAGLEVGARDVYVNVVGGLSLVEPAADLAVAAAVASSLLNKALPEGAVVVGETGLGGEVRSVPAAELRVKEAANMGMKEIHLPQRNVNKMSEGSAIKLRPVKTLQQFINDLFV